MNNPFFVGLCKPRNSFHDQSHNALLSYWTKNINANSVPQSRCLSSILLACCCGRRTPRASSSVQICRKRRRRHETTGQKRYLATCTASRDGTGGRSANRAGGRRSDASGAYLQVPERWREKKPHLNVANQPSPGHRSWYKVLVIVNISTTKMHETLSEGFGRPLTWHDSCHVPPLFGKVFFL